MAGFSSPFGLSSPVQPTPAAQQKKQAAVTQTPAQAAAAEELNANFATNPNLLASATTLNILQPSPKPATTVATPAASAATAVSAPSSAGAVTLTGKQATAYAQTSGLTPAQFQQYQATGSVSLAPNAPTFTGPGGVSSYGGVSSAITPAQAAALGLTAQQVAALTGTPVAAAAAPTSTPSFNLAPFASASALGALVNPFLTAAEKAAQPTTATATIGATPETVPVSVVPGSVVQNTTVYEGQTVPDLYNYTVTVQLANGQKIPNVQVNVPVSYLSQLEAQGLNAPIIQQIALGNLNGAQFTTTQASTQATGGYTGIQPTNVGSLLASAGVAGASGQAFGTQLAPAGGIGGTGIGTPGGLGSGGTVQPAPLLIQYLNGQPIGFITPGSLIPTFSTTAEGYTFTIAPSGGIEITQNGQNVGTYNPSATAAVGYGNQAAQVGTLGYQTGYGTSPGLIYVNPTTGQQVAPGAAGAIVYNTLPQQISYLQGVQAGTKPSTTFAPLAYLQAQQAQVSSGAPIAFSGGVQYPQTTTSTQVSSSYPPSSQPLNQLEYNVGSDINNFLTGIQGGINQYANTPYRPSFPLLPSSTSGVPYNVQDQAILQNIKNYGKQTIGQFALDIENIPNYVKGLPSLSVIPNAGYKFPLSFNSGSDLQTLATLENTMNQLVKNGNVPWYFPYVANLLLESPIIATNLGAATLGLATTASGASTNVFPLEQLLQNTVFGSAGLAAYQFLQNAFQEANASNLFSSITGIENTGLGTAQAPSLLSNVGNAAFMGASIGEALSPISTIAGPLITKAVSQVSQFGPALETLGEVGTNAGATTLTDVAAQQIGARTVGAIGQSAFDLANFFAATTAAQIIQQGQVPTGEQLLKAYEFGALLGTIVPAGAILGTILEAPLAGVAGEGLGAIGRTATTLGIGGLGQAAIGQATGSTLTPLENFLIGVGLPIGMEVGETGLRGADYLKNLALYEAGLGEEPQFNISSTYGLKLLNMLGISPLEAPLIPVVNAIPDNVDILKAIITEPRNTTFRENDIQLPNFSNYTADQLREFILSNSEYFKPLLQQFVEAYIPKSTILSNLKYAYDNGTLTSNVLDPILQAHNINATGLTDAQKYKEVVDFVNDNPAPRLQMLKGFTLGNAFNFQIDDIIGLLKATTVSPEGSILVHISDLLGLYNQLQQRGYFAVEPSSGRFGGINRTLSAASLYASNPIPGSEAKAFGPTSKPEAYLLYGKVTGNENEETSGIGNANTPAGRYYGNLQFNRLGGFYLPDQFTDDYKNSPVITNYPAKTQAAFYAIRSAELGQNILGGKSFEFTGSENENQFGAFGTQVQTAKPFDIYTLMENQGLFRGVPILNELFPDIAKGTFSSTQGVPTDLKTIYNRMLQSPLTKQEMESVPYTSFEKTITPGTDYTGQPLDRLTGRIIYKTTDGAYWLVQEKSGLWNFAGGGRNVNSGESAAEGAVRGFNEETGLKIDPTQAKPVLSGQVGNVNYYYNTGLPFRDITDVFEVTSDTPIENSKLDTKELIKAIKYTPGDKLGIALSPDARAVADKLGIKITQDIPAVQLQKGDTIRFDLDQTLIGSNGQQRPYAQQLIDSLIAQGFKVAIVTHSLSDEYDPNYGAQAKLTRAGFDPSQFSQIITRTDYGPANSDVSTPKPFEKFGIKVLIDNDPAQVSEAWSRGQPAIEISTYEGGYSSEGLLRLQNQLEAYMNSEAPTETIVNEAKETPLSQKVPLPASTLNYNTNYEAVPTPITYNLPVSTARPNYEYAASPTSQNLSYAYQTPSLYTSAYATPSSYQSSYQTKPSYAISYASPTPSYATSYATSNPYATSYANPQSYQSPYGYPSPYAYSSPYEYSTYYPTYPSTYYYETPPYKKEIIPFPNGRTPYSPDQRIIQSQRQGYQNIYSPSLTVRLFPNTEAAAERNYNPLFASAGLRPEQVPQGAAPLFLQPEIGPTTTTTTYPVGGVYNPKLPVPITTVSSPTAEPITTPSPTAATPITFNQGSPASQVVSQIPDPSTMQFYSNPANAQGPSLVLAPGQTAPISPFAAGQLSQLEAALGISAPKPKGTAMALSAPQAQQTPTAISSPYSTAGVPVNMQSLVNLGQGRSYIPSGSVLLSAIPPQQLLQLLNQISPQQFPASGIQFSGSRLLQMISNISYEQAAYVFAMLPYPQKVQVLELEGIPPGEAAEYAQGYSEGILPFPSALAGPQRKRIAEPISSGAEIGKVVMV